MANLLKDKYFITGLTLVLIFSLIWVSFKTENTEDYCEGVVYDIRKSEKGFVFLMDQTDGKTQKCFFRKKPENLGIYRVKGEYSEDGSMFFVKTMMSVKNK